jgi:LysM repeat protein
MTTLFLLLIVSYFSRDLNIVKGSTQDLNKTFRSVKIEKDDTLWTIAENNMNEYHMNIHTYIKEIKVINNLTSDQINAGEYLIIPFFASNESY